MSNKLPAVFEEQMREQLGEQYPAFAEALHLPSPVSIRLHPLKGFNWKENIGQVKWYSNGVYLSQRPVFTLDPRFQAGAYYVQEASSMLLAEALRQLISPLEPVRALDLCAAPGGKSTLLSDVLHPDSLILCNEVIRQRYGVLQYNLSKWGRANTHASQHDSADFRGLEGFFDLVLVDAPCSGEGMFRKDPAAITEWSPSHVELCAARQKRILAEAAQLLRPGGILLYSTCTYNDHENADNARWLGTEQGLSYLPLDFPADWQIAPRAFGYQCYPHCVNGEGLYLAAFRRQSDTGVSKQNAGKNFRRIQALNKNEKAIASHWLAQPESFELFTAPDGIIRALPVSQMADLLTIDGVLRQWSAGFAIGEIKGKDFIPSPELALSLHLSQQLPRAELSHEQALAFLRKEDFGLSPIPQGWQLASYEQLGLGWFKGLPNRINNYYPKGWRILMEG